MTEQAEGPLDPKGESQGVDKCGPKWPARGPKHRLGRDRNSRMLFCYNGIRAWSG
jgi:hypothetical protein